MLSLIQIVCGIFLFAEESIYNSSEDYDKRIAFQEVRLKPETDTVIFETNVPDGDYLVMLVHDINNNSIKKDLVVSAFLFYIVFQNLHTIYTK